jgi:beta-hydroxyacyl-ACP dehydratase FabZ
METILDSQAIQKLLPHRYPFLLVDRIVELVPRERIVGIKQVSINESFFQGHFPGAPVMPGVLVVEALAQVGAVLALREIEDRDQKLVLFTGIKEARFRRPVVPGDTLVLEVTALRIGSRVQRMHGEAKVDGQLAADAEIMSIVVPRESDSVRSCRPLLIRLRFIPPRLLVRRPGLVTTVLSVLTVPSVTKSCSATRYGSSLTS